MAWQDPPQANDWKMDPAGKWHFIGRSGSGGAANAKSRVWACSGCKSSNYSKNACGTCGMRRSWAEVVKTPADTTQPKNKHMQQSPPHVTQNKVEQQLAEISEKLKLATAGKITLKCGQPVGVKPHSSAEAPAPDVGAKSHLPADAPGAEESATRSQLVSSLTQLESALAALPEGQGNDVHRTYISENIEEKRRLLGETKREKLGVGKRLDMARAAMERAQKRKSIADDSVALALSAQENATAELEQISSEVTSLQQQLSSSSSSVTSMEELEMQLVAAVESLELCEAISPDSVTDARNQSLELLRKFKQSLDLATIVQGGGRPRMHGKQVPQRPMVPPEAVGIDPLRRIPGKTPGADIPRQQQSFIASHFSNKRQCLFSGGKRERASSLDWTM